MIYGALLSWIIACVYVVTILHLVIVYFWKFHILRRKCSNTRYRLLRIGWLITYLSSGRMNNLSFINVYFLSTFPSYVIKQLNYCIPILSWELFILIKKQVSTCSSSLHCEYVRRTLYVNGCQNLFFQLQQIIADLFSHNLQKL